MVLPLLVSTFLIATCGLGYELLAGTVASYLLGDSVTQFSTVIGVYLFAMGVGSWAVKYVGRGLVAIFVQVEIVLALVGGLSAPLLFLAFDRVAGFRLVLYLLVSAVGILVGMEIPLLLRILKDQLQFHDLVSKVLSLDYLGALAASVLFPLWMLPRLGPVRGSLAFGLLNAAVALWTAWLFRERVGPAARFLLAEALLVTLLLGTAMGFAGRITDLADERLYPDDVIWSKQTPYQRIVVTRSRSDVRLYLNGHLQFSSFDEYRYHEALVHPGLAAVADPRRVLVLGGGDGLAVREILRSPKVREVLLVDLDPEMTRLFRDHPSFSALNGHSLSDPRVRIANEDAFVWLESATREGLFDFVVVDFPDPSNFSVGKLYTTAFYERARRRIAPGGRMVVQSTSPFFAPRSFATINRTIEASGFTTDPYHVYVPSFGEWGFVLAGEGPAPRPTTFPSGLRFLNAEAARSLFDFPADMPRLAGEVNRLANQLLVHAYEAEWRAIAP